MNRSAIVSLGLLDSIIGNKRKEVAALRLREAEIRAHVRINPYATSGGPSFREALVDGPCVSVIAEVKRRSPSGGAIREDADPVETATAYKKGGARAISVLTDADYFGGSLADLQAVTSSVDLPVIRKDFIIDELQILEAVSAGASAVLLIVRLLEPQELRDLQKIAEDHRLDALIEVHDARELDVALNNGARIIGINNRDLDTLQIDLAVSEALIPQIPADVIRVAESGIKSAGDVMRMANAGADAVLVGESLMRNNDANQGAAALSCIPRTRQSA